MISFLNKFKKVILVAIVVCFLGSLGYVGAGAIKEEYGPNAPVAKVGKENIKYKDYDRMVRDLSKTLQNEEGEEEDFSKQEQLKQLVLSSLIFKSALKQEALSAGLGVSNMEVAYYIQNSPLFNVSGSFSKNTYLWILRNNMGMTAAEYEQKLKDTKLAESYQEILTFVAKTSPQEEEFLKKVLFKGQKEASTQIRTRKIEDLLGNFSQDFNQKNFVTFTSLAPSYQG